MADYRQISQDYAREAIKAALLLNGGAAVALLSQTAELLKAGLADEIRCAMLLWVAGMTLAALLWLFAFLSTRYVDKSEREPQLSNRHIMLSNGAMYAAVVGFLVSLGLFAAGCWAFAEGVVNVDVTVLQPAQTGRSS